MKIKDLIFATTSDDFYQELEGQSQSFYLGIDPTGDALHIGHLAALVFAKRLIDHGHKFYVVLGGLTAMIGDPSGKNKERQLLDLKTLKTNVTSLKKWLKAFFKDDVTILNNLDWLQMDLVTFLRDYGKLFNLNTMISKDQIANRLTSGISFTETSYQILQAMDFAHLKKTYDISVQIGGQDQWGNLVAGLELIRKSLGFKTKAFGLTLPLITKADGSKFGKSEAGTIWLDKTKTTPYQMYQFLFNTPDGEVLKLVKYLTLIDDVKYKELVTSMRQDSSLRESQHYLADHVVTMLYGTQALDDAKLISQALFTNDFSQLKPKHFTSFKSSLPCVTLEEKKVPILDLLIAAGVATSRKKGRQFMIDSAIAINGELAKDFDIVITPKQALYDKFIIIKKGKRNYFLAIFK